MDEIKQFSGKHGIAASTLCEALLVPRATYYRHGNKGKPVTRRGSPSNKLTENEKQQLLNLMHSERFIDCSPYEIFYTLLDKEKQYHGSIRSMYRLLLEQHGQVKERRNVRNHRDAVKPELMACKPNDVWSWDITKLLGTQRFVYYYLYVILDIYSRYVVGWMLAEAECQLLAKKLIQTSALRQGIQPGQLTLHADNGPSMTSITVGQLLEHLGIQKSHNRPYTSNDNPFSESQFKTLKYCSRFPERFDSFERAETYCQQFFQWYNSQHYHSGIAYLMPETVHYGNDELVLRQRHQTLMAAYIANPARFNNKPPRTKVLKPVYINPPKTVEIQAGQKVVNMA